MQWCEPKEHGPTPAAKWLKPDAYHQVYFLHGDEFEDIKTSTVSYYCAICDRFTQPLHFKEHPRDQHIARIEISLRALCHIACSKYVCRGGDADTNLIERALRRERGES
jgi:hypothetical protein